MQQYSRPLPLPLPLPNTLTIRFLLQFRLFLTLMSTEVFTWVQSRGNVASTGLNMSGHFPNIHNMSSLNPHNLEFTHFSTGPRKSDLNHPPSDDSDGQMSDAAVDKSFPNGWSGFKSWPQVLFGAPQNFQFSFNKRKLRLQKHICNCQSMI